jgi:chemotaxis protein MotA
VDKSTLTGLFLALGGILIGLLIEGGRVAQVLQPTAAMIVFGGTLGAVMVQFPLRTVIGAFKQLSLVFLDRASDANKLVKEMVRYAYRARRDGIISLDADLEKIKDPFLKKALMLAVDGTEPEELRKIMNLDLQNRAERSDKTAHVFESAGGFAPTIGIIGAILGLIQVMQHLQNIDEVGRGIAVAFVATIYGVGSANLLFLPWAGKLKIKSREEELLREMTLEGVVSILEGMNPRMLETKLHSYLIEPVRDAARRPESLKV